MTRVLIDTNVILDALFDRAPWATDAVAIFEANRLDAIGAHVTASSLTDVFYVARKLADQTRAWAAVALCVDQLAILPVSLSELQLALSGPGTDLEDNLQIACASIARLDAIVTRDPKGFAGSPIPVLSPAELLVRIPKADDVRQRPPAPQ